MFGKGNTHGGGGGGETNKQQRGERGERERGERVCVYSQLAPPTHPQHVNHIPPGDCFPTGALYMFYGLAIICEGKFKDSIMEMTAALKISPDVAGATIMAAGTSSPELFISLVALLSPGNDDMGAGTIVGSAIFNIAVIIGGSAIFCGEPAAHACGGNKKLES